MNAMLPFNPRDLPVHQQAALKATAIENRIRSLQAAGDAEEVLEELELLFGEITFKWDADKGVAHFNGFITEQSVSSARKMLSECEDCEKLTIYINSPGGNAIAGVALFNMLSRAEMQVETIAIGTAYSAASLLFCGGDTRLVAPAASVGIHRSWTLAIGDGEEMLSTAAQLERMDNSILSVYKTRCEKAKRGEVKDAMWADTMLTAKEAISFGLATGAAPLPKKKPKTSKKAKEGADEAEQAEEASATLPEAETMLERVLNERLAEISDAVLRQPHPDAPHDSAAEVPASAVHAHRLSDLVDPSL